MSARRKFQAPAVDPEVFLTWGIVAFIAFAVAPFATAGPALIHEK